TRVRLLDLDGRELLSRPLPGPGTLLGLDLLSGPEPRFLRRVADEIHIMDPEERVRARLPGLPGMIAGPACLSQDGTRLAVGWGNAGEWQVLVYEPQGAKPVLTRVNAECFTWALAISPDRTRLAAAGEDGVARVWDSATGQLLAACRGHLSKVYSV